MVIIIGSKGLSVRFKFRLPDIPIEPEYLRMIAFYQFTAPQQPIIHILRTHRHSVFGIEWIEERGWTVKVGIRGVAHIRVPFLPFVHIPPVLASMRRQPKDEPLFARCLGYFADNIALGAHFGGVPPREIGVVHRKAVVMFGDRDNVLRPGFLEDINPLVRIKLFGFEHGNEIFIAKFIDRTILLHVMLIIVQSPCHRIRVH